MKTFKCIIMGLRCKSVTNRIVGWFNNGMNQMDISIEPYMAEYSLIIRVGWLWGGRGFARVDYSVSPPGFLKWTPGNVEESRLDLTLPNFWRALTREG